MQIFQFQNLETLNIMGKLKLYSAILSVAVLAACQKDPDTSVSQNPLNKELRTSLEKASPNGDLNYFQLPESTDFSNIPQDPKNPITKEKVALGKMLFHETHMGLKPKVPSGMHSYSCASCHHAGAGFKSGMAQGLGDGGSGFGNLGETRAAASEYNEKDIDFQPIASPTVLNSAYQTVMLWNGQFGATGKNAGTESQWTAGTPKAVNHQGFEGVETQALAGLDVHRLVVDSTLLTEANYQSYFDAAYPNVPRNERVTKENAALAIAAYERTVLANEAPFQKWLAGHETAMNDSEKRGALLFFGKAQCNNCHSGPALNSMEFFALGMDDLDGKPDMLGSVDMATRKGRGGFTGNPADDFKFKVPQLYGLKHAAFYGHGSSFRSIKELVQYKNKAVAENSRVPESQLAANFRPLHLTENEVNNLVAFLENALNDDQLARYEPTSTPSGYCFPNNDAQSKADRGCD